MQSHTTVDQDIAHKLRPRLFPNFVVNLLFPQNNPVLFWVISSLLHTFMTVDNMLVGTKTEKGHDEIVKEVLRRLEKNDLYVIPEKCIWKVKKIKFLEVVTGSNRIEIEKEKIDRVLSWPEPKNIKDIRKFLGLADYYRRFIKDFAQTARPVNMLTRKNMK